MTVGPDLRRAHVVEDQSAVFALLERPETHGRRDPVVRIDTHGAAVFLSGPDAYKVKRAVRFPFMDFSTLDKRRAACLAEVEINGPGAPGVYLGAVPITRGPHGLELAGEGPAVDYAVHMRRFDETTTLDRVADAGGLTGAMIDDLVAAVLAAHGRAPLRDGASAADGLGRYLQQNREAFAENADVFDPGRADALGRRMAAALAAVRPLLVERGALGRVRRCHGDLHLANVALIDGRPVLFDAVEFDDGIATCDVLYDLAYLVMDLWERGEAHLANRALNRYLAASEPADLDGLAALPLFIALRATIRAKVIAAGLPTLPADRRERATGDALRYFAVAEAAIAPVPPRLVAVGGLSGTGKSTLAAALAPRLGRIPGAVVLRSDETRKRLAGVADTDRLPSDAYTAAAGAQVYTTLRRHAARALAAGAAVIVDAVHARPEERAAIGAVAVAAGVRFTGLWLDAPVEILARRADARHGDASDADAAVVYRQAAYALGRIDWTTLSAGERPQETERTAAVALGLAAAEDPPSPRPLR